MKAVLLYEYGGADKLHYVTDAPDPELGDHEVLVAQAATSVNPIDYKMRSGEAAARYPLIFPAILGRDVSGIVRAIGTRVSGVAVGDRVIAVGNATYAELTVVPASEITHVPEGLDLIDAAALPLVAVTGDQLVREACNVQPGQTVLVSGATGSVGRCAVHSAKSLGAKVIAGVRKQGLDEANALGVDAVVALDDKDSFAGLGLLDAVADTVGGDTASALLGKLREGGVFGSLLGPVKGSELHPTVRVVPMSAHPDAARLKTFAEDLRDAKFTLPIGRRLPLQDAATAQTLAEKGGVGKVVLLVL